MISIEDLDKVLEQAQLQIVPSQNTDDYFDRNRVFLVDGVEYRIEWWSNIGYLHIGNFQMSFDNVWVDNNSPVRHKSKMDLRFSYYGERYVGLLHLVDWK